MALTKVSGGILDPGINVAGIVTATGFDGPFTGGSSKNITAGIITATGFDLNGNGDISGNLVIGGNLTANGDFTTLNTTLREVEILRVDANTTAVAGIITQRGSGDIFSAYDTSTEVFKIADGGTVTVTGSNINMEGGSGALTQLKINSTGRFRGIQLDENGTRKAHFQHDATDNTTVVGTAEGTMQFNSGDTPRVVLNSSGHWVPYVDSTYDLGINGTRWRNVYADNVIVGVGLTLADNIPASFGNSNDLQIVHQSGENHFLLNSGNTFFKGNVAWGVRNSSNQNIIQANGTGRTVELYGGTNNVLSTTSAGVTIRNGLYIENAEFNMTTNGSKVLDFETGGSNGVYFRHNPSDGALSTFMQATHGGSLALYDDSDGAVKLTTQGTGVMISGILKIERGSASDTALEINTTATSGACRIKFNESGTTKSQIAYSHANDQLEIIGASGNSLAFFSGGSQVWNIDTNGHLLPNTAGDVNIGSATAEIGDVYIADDKKLYLGSSQDVQLYFDGGHTRFLNNTGQLDIRNNSLHLQSVSGGIQNYAKFLYASGVELYYVGSSTSSKKFETSATGITVTGEVAATQDYPNQRPALDFNFAQEKVLDPRLMFARDGDASYYDEFGLVRIVGRNEPRFDHDPVTRESKGLLMEENRTNLLPHSIPDSNWNLSHATITENAGIAPDGTNTAVLHSDTNTNNQHLMYAGSITVSSGANYVITSHLKQPSSNSRRYYSVTIHGLGYIIFDVQNGTVHSSSGTGIQGASITALRNGWYRVMAHYVTTSTTGNIYWLPIADDGVNVVYTGASTAQGMLVWGCQLEEATFPTSYIPTNGAVKTRYQDTMIMTGDDVTNVFNTTEGTMFYEASVTDLTNDNQPIVTFNDRSNAAGNEIAMGYRTGGGSSGNIRTWMRSYVTGSQVNSFLSNHASTGLVGGKPYRHIFGFKKDDAADSYNTGTNSAQTTDTSGNLPVAGSIDQLRFGSYYNETTISQYPLESGHIKRFSYWPVRLTNTQLTTYIA